MVWGFAYLTLAVSVTCLSWRSPIRCVGLALTLASGMTSLAFYALPFAYRVILEILLSLAIATAAAQCWRTERGALYRAILLLAAADAVMCAAVCWIGSSDAPTRSLFALISNAIFFVQCICVGVPGARDAVRAWVRNGYVRRNMDRQSCAAERFRDGREP